MASWAAMNSPLCNQLRSGSSATSTPPTIQRRWCWRWATTPPKAIEERAD